MPKNGRASVGHSRKRSERCPDRRDPVRRKVQRIVNLRTGPVVLRKDRDKHLLRMKLQDIQIVHPIRFRKDQSRILARILVVRSRTELRDIQHLVRRALLLRRVHCRTIGYQIPGIRTRPAGRRDSVDCNRQLAIRKASWNKAIRTIRTAKFQVRIQIRRAHHYPNRPNRACCLIRQTIVVRSVSAQHFVRSHRRPPPTPVTTINRDIT